MVHDGSPDPLPTPPDRSRHPFKDAFIVRLELAEPGTVLDFEPKEVHAGTCVFFGVVSTLALSLDLAVTPFLGEPCESGFEWSTAGVVVHQRGVDAEGVTDPEGFEVGFEGVTDEDGRGTISRCNDGKKLSLYLGEGRCSCREGCLCYTRPSTWWW